MRDASQSNRAGKNTSSISSVASIYPIPPLTATNRLTFKGKYFYYRESSISSTDISGDANSGNVLRHLDYHSNDDC